MAKKCMKCGGATKMKKGGAFIAGIPNAGQTGPNKFVVTETMKKGGSVKKKRQAGGVSGPDGLYTNTTPGEIAKPRKARFGSSVPVQHSPAPGRVRSASGVGTVPVGKRKKMGGATKRK